MTPSARFCSVTRSCARTVLVCMCTGDLYLDQRAARRCNRTPFGSESAIRNSHLYDECMRMADGSGTGDYTTCMNCVYWVSPSYGVVGIVVIVIVVMDGMDGVAPFPRGGGAVVWH